MKRNIIPLVFALVLMVSCSSPRPSPVSTAAPTAIVMMPDQASPTPSVQEKKIEIPSFNPVNGKGGALIPVCNCEPGHRRRQRGPPEGGENVLRGGQRHEGEDALGRRPAQANNR